MNYKYLLSLVMPTFNRKDEIQISIKTILSTLPDNNYKNDIELLILDNGSDYDIEHILQNTLRLAEEKLTIRIIKNGENIGNDQNFLKGLCEAQGKYILQCSDRYYYNIDFPALLPFLKVQNPTCVIWSDRFRKYTQTEITLNNSYKDEWLKEEFKITSEDDTFFEIETKELLKSNYIKSGLINAITDVLFVNQGTEYWQKFTKYFNTYMLCIVDQLDAVDFCVNSNFNVHIFRVNQNKIIHQNVGRNTMYTRHNYNEIAVANFLAQAYYPFIGTSNEIKLLQVTGLMNLYLKDKAGLYLAFVKPDKDLINQIITDNKLPLKWHQKIDLFFINYTPPSVVLKSYLFLKNIYLILKLEFAKFKNDSIIVKQLQKDFEDQL